MLSVPLASLAQPGQLIGGKYRIERFLGEGGMGLVALAKHTERGTRVAVKMLHPALATDAQRVARFRREARIASLLRTEHSAKVSDFGTDASGAMYLVMEYLDGHDLAAALHRSHVQGERLAVTFVCDSLLQACEAIAEAHASGVVHRDLKPANLFLTRRRDGTPILKVLDFGISKQVEPGQVAMTVTQQTMGSPLYMSPEQFRSSKHVTAATDIWSIGVVLYELLTGRVPFESEEIGELFLQILHESPVAPRVLRSDLPEALEALVLRCLAKDPAQRPRDVSELAQALAPFASPAVRPYAAAITAVLRVASPRPPLESSPRVDTTAPRLGSSVQTDRARPTMLTQPPMPTPAPRVSSPLPRASPGLSVTTMMRSPLAGMSFKVDDFTCTVTNDGIVKMVGALQMRSPSAQFGPFLRQIHDLATAARLPEVPVDVKELHHVNSSSLFLFLDWARWIAAAPADARYTLHFMMRTGVQWQHLTLPTMQRICNGSLRTSTS